MAVQETLVHSIIRGQDYWMCFRVGGNLRLQWCPAQTSCTPTHSFFLPGYQFPVPCILWWLLCLDDSEIRKPLVPRKVLITYSLKKNLSLPQGSSLPCTGTRVSNYIPSDFLLGLWKQAGKYIRTLYPVCFCKWSFNRTVSYVPIMSLLATVVMLFQRN